MSRHLMAAHLFDGIVYLKNSAFFAMKLSHLAGTSGSAKIADTGQAGTHASQSMQVAGSMYIWS
jgi:hypothetical protein